MHQDTASAPAGATPTHDTSICPTGFDSARLYEAVAMYEAVARSPRPGAFHFHVGAESAVQRLGYSASELATLPVKFSSETQVASAILSAGKPVCTAPRRQTIF
jgi:hypothetical protein